jgi:hypothetical protein
MSSKSDLVSRVEEAASEQAERSVDMGVNYAAKGKLIRNSLLVVIGLVALVVAAFMIYVGSYGPLGKGFVGIATICLFLRAYSEFASNRIK